MSAFIVAHAHIDALLDFAMRADRHVVPNLDRADLTAEGRKLMTANVRSVCTRYHKYEDAYADALAYTFRFPTRRLAAVEALKACECFDYQACEFEGYAESPAGQLISRIRS